MKNLLLFVMAFFLLGSLQAQTGKGNWAFGLHNFSAIVPGSSLLAPTNALGISFGKNKNEFNGQTFESKVTTVGLSGSAHYFIVDNFSAGLNLNFFIQKEKEDDGARDEFSTSIFMVGPELRYYIPAGAKTKVYLRGQAGFGNVTDKFNGDKQGDPTKLSQYAGGAGLAIFPNPHVSIDLGLGFGIFKAKDDDDDVFTNSGGMLDVGFTVFL